MCVCVLRVISNHRDKSPDKQTDQFVVVAEDNYEVTIILYTTHQCRDDNDDDDDGQGEVRPGLPSTQVSPRKQCEH